MNNGFLGKTLAEILEQERLEREEKESYEASLLIADGDKADMQEIIRTRFSVDEEITRECIYSNDNRSVYELREENKSLRETQGHILEDNRRLSEENEELSEENGILINLIKMIKVDLYARADQDDDGCKVVNISNFLWAAINNVAEE